MAQMAEILGLKGASGYQRYEDEQLYTKPFLPITAVQHLQKALSGKGDPPITNDEIWRLSGLMQKDILGGAFVLESEEESETEQRIGRKFSTVVGEGRIEPLIDRDLLTHIFPILDKALRESRINFTAREFQSCLFFVHDFFSAERFGIIHFPGEPPYKRGRQQREMPLPSEKDVEEFGVFVAHRMQRASKNA